MPLVEPFHRGLVERYLQANGIPYSVDPSGDFYVEYQYDEDCSCSISVFLTVDEDEALYSVQVQSDRRFPMSEWERCVWLCNAWNRETGSPMAYLDVGDPTRDDTRGFPTAARDLGAGGVDPAGEIRLEQNFDLKAGLHQELLDALTNGVIDGAFAFWRWAHMERSL